MFRLVTAIIVSALIVSSAPFAQTRNVKGGGLEQLNLFGEAFDRIRQDAVEPVVDNKLIEAAIAGMLSGLDIRSAFISDAALKASQGTAKDGGATLGLAVTMDNGQLKVISPQDESPAAQAGIAPGDVIFAIDKEPTYDLTLGEVEQKLRGPAGSEVKLTLRHATGKPIDLAVKREPFRLQTVSAHLESDNIGYVRIAGFDDVTQAALAGVVRELREHTGDKLAGLVLDLRNNPGGVFNAAVGTADAFIDKGDIVVIKGRKPSSTQRISATPGDLAQGLPIVALINGGTAREAELVAGALQDNHRAVLLGTLSFGESSIETVIPVSGNGAIRLTTARFMTPSGRQIQGKGIAPDLTVMPAKLEKLAQGDRLREADLKGALKNTDPVAPVGKPPADPASGAAAAGSAQHARSVATGEIGSALDEQLSEAVDVLRGLALINGRAN